MNSRALVLPFPGRQPQHDEGVGREGLHFGSLMGVDHILHSEIVEPELGSQPRQQLGVSVADHVDPQHRLSSAELANPV